MSSKVCMVEEEPERQCLGPCEVLAWLPGAWLFSSGGSSTGSDWRPTTTPSVPLTPQDTFGDDLSGLAPVREPKRRNVVAVMCSGGCGKPAWNGKPGQYCTRACKEQRAPKQHAAVPEAVARQVVHCAWPSCERPAMGGEFCSRACASKAACMQPAAGQAVPAPFQSREGADAKELARRLSLLQDPDLVESTASTAETQGQASSASNAPSRSACELKVDHVRGRTQIFTKMMERRVEVVVFSYDGQDEGCEKVCRSNFFLSNLYDLGSAGGVSVKAYHTQSTWRNFRSAEAAFLALKYWQRAGEFENITSREAFQLQQISLGREDTTFAGYDSAWTAMFSVLRQKFRPGSELAQQLLDTSEAFLLCHCANPGLDAVWSDNGHGGGANWLGMQLMLVRDELRKKDGRWSNAIRLGVDVETGSAHSSIAAATWRQATTVASEGLQYAEAKLLLAD